MQYFFFLPIVVLFYYVLPEKVRYIWLLAASYYFYMQWNPLYIVLMLLCTCLTYVGGRVIGNLREPGSSGILHAVQNIGGGVSEKAEDMPCSMYCVKSVYSWIL